MSQIDTLLSRYCPDGVAFRSLRELGETYSGLSGKSKADFSNGNVRFVSYKNIYNNLSVDLRADDFVRVGQAERQNALAVGDVLLTGSSETPNDVGMSSVVLNEPHESIYLNSFCFGLRFNEPQLFLPGFSKHLFRSSMVRREIAQCASGVTRFNISKNRFLRIRIPVPPLEVQHAIANVLDRFVELEASLKAELEARRQQYKHYRDALLSFGEPSTAKAAVRWTTLGDAGSLFRGLTGKTKADFGTGSARFVSYVNVFNNIRTDIAPDTYVKVGEGESQTCIRRGDILFTGSSETPEEVGMSSVVTNEPSGPLYLNSFCFGFRATHPLLLEPEFAKHLFRSETMRRRIVQTASGVTRFNISKERFRRIEVPIPPMADQKRIASVHDAFEALVGDLSIGLPAELNARRRQYVHYRDRLLTFKEAA